MKIACMLSIGYGVDSNSPSIVLSWLLCFWLHSVMVLRFAPDLRINMKRLLFFCLFCFFNCPLGLRSSRAALRARSKLQPEEKEFAKGQNQQSKEQDAPFKPDREDKQMKDITQRLTNRTTHIENWATEGDKMYSRTEETRQEIMKGGRWEKSSMSSTVWFHTVSARVCLCAPAMERLPFHHGAANITHCSSDCPCDSQWQLLPKLLWKNSFGESRLFVHSARLSSPTAQTGWCFFLE